MKVVQIQQLHFRINKMLSVGLIKYWKQLYWPNNDECSMSGSTEMNVVMVNLMDMQGSFYVLLLGQ